MSMENPIWAERKDSKCADIIKDCLLFIYVYKFALEKRMIVQCTIILFSRANLFSIENQFVLEKRMIVNKLK